LVSPDDALRLRRIAVTPSFAIKELYP